MQKKGYLFYYFTVELLWFCSSPCIGLMVLIRLYEGQEGWWHNNQSQNISGRLKNQLHFKNSSLFLPAHSKTEDRWLCQLAPEAVAQVLCSVAWGDCATTLGTGGQWGPGPTCFSLCQCSQSDTSGDSPSLSFPEHTSSVSALVALVACLKGCSGHHTWTQPGFPAPNRTCGWQVHTKANVVSCFSNGQPLSCT